MDRDRRKIPRLFVAGEIPARNVGDFGIIVRPIRYANLDIQFSTFKDNAVELSLTVNFGGKNSSSHHATVVGDTVGDPFKDTSGPSLNILIKLMSMVSIVMAGLTVMLHA